MSTQIHCDRRGCTSVSPVKDATWFTIDRDRQTMEESWPKHFCSMVCIAVWSAPQIATGADIGTPAETPDGPTIGRSLPDSGRTVTPSETSDDGSSTHSDGRK